MAAFEFVAVDLEGRQSRGHMPAETAEQARRELRLRQLIPIEVRPVAPGGDGKLRVGRETFAARTRVQIIRQLAAVISAGLPVEQAFSIVASQSSLKASKSLHQVRKAISEGARLPEALRVAPGLFPPAVRSAIAAGDSIGQLGLVLDRLSLQLERSDALTQKMRAAAIYPILVAVFSSLLIAALMIVIVPKLVTQFDTLDTDLPILTQAVIAVSDGLRTHGAVLLGLSALAFWLLYGLMKRPTSRAVIDGVVLRIPFAGGMIKAAEGSRFARLFSVLLSSGATLLDALGSAKATLSNRAMRVEAEQIIDEATEGAPVGQVFNKARSFPPLLVQMIVTGDAGRNLPLMLDRAADYLERDFETRSSTLIALIEPAIILVLGAVISVVVLAIMLPLIQLNTYAIN